MTDKADKAQQAIHKAAFASYKANEFLKHSVKPERLEHEKKSSAKQRLEEADPFNFPELDQTVAKVISDEAVQPRINDHGDFLDRPGRRFTKMSDQEFLESYFGKDNLRNAVVDRNDDPMFLEQKTLKERFPSLCSCKAPPLSVRSSNFWIWESTQTTSLLIGTDMARSWLTLPILKSQQHRI